MSDTDNMHQTVFDRLDTSLDVMDRYADSIQTGQQVMEFALAILGNMKLDDKYYGVGLEKELDAFDVDLGNIKDGVQVIKKAIQNMHQTVTVIEERVDTRS